MRPICPARRLHAGVCEKNTPPEKNTRWTTSFQSTKSGAGLQFLLWDCRARACAQKECFVHRSQYHIYVICVYMCVYIYIYIYIYYFADRRKNEHIIYEHTT